MKRQPHRRSKRPRGTLPAVTSPAQPERSTWRCNACHQEIQAPAVSMGVNIRNARTPHALCPATPQGFWIATSFQEPEEWRSPTWADVTKRLLGRMPEEEEIIARGFLSLAELCFCVGMDPVSAAAWWAVFSADLGPYPSEAKGILIGNSPILRGMWAAGKISSTGMDGYEDKRRGDLSREWAALGAVRRGRL